MMKSVNATVHRGARTTTTTYTISVADKGSTIATGGILTGLRYIAPPAKQAQKHPAYLTLQDDGASPTVTLFNLDFNSYPLAFPSANSALSIYNNQLIADASIRVTNLTITNIASVMQFEIDVS